MSRFGFEPDETNDFVICECRQCHSDVLYSPDEPIPDGPHVCDRCIRETVNREHERMGRLPKTARMAEPAIYADLLECSERAVRDALEDFKRALANARTVNDALVLHHRLQALYLGIDQLSVLALEKADALCDVQRSA